jgi:arsenite methyltransferase
VPGVGTDKVCGNQRRGLVIDLDSGAGIDVFLSANHVGKSGKVIGIDKTDEMLEKARKNALNFIRTV